METEGIQNDTTYFPNMDLVRYVLAFAVFLSHIQFLAGIEMWFPLTSYDAVGGFFALSGFLMYHSYTKHHSFLRYTAQRARRILPPYIFIVVLCAFGLLFLSDLPPAVYLGSAGLWEYLGANLAFLNWLQPYLPGVFKGAANVAPYVNGSLWTMKVEWCLYFSVPLFVWLLGLTFGKKRRRIGKSSLALMVIAISIIYRLVFYFLWLNTQKPIYDLLGRQIFSQLAFFYCGMYIYFHREWFMRHNLLMLLLGVVLYIVGSAGPIPMILFTPVGLSVLVMSLSFIPKDIAVLRHRGNISYEIYLFHWPVIQTTVSLGLLQFGSTAFCAITIAATVLLSLVFSVFWRRCLRSH